MSAEKLLREIEACGVSARAVGDELKLRVPRGALDARVLDEVRAAKLEIIALLKEREYSQVEAAPDVAAAALAKLAREVDAARVGAHVRPTKAVIEAWGEAQAATGMPLSLRGLPR